MRKKVFLTGMFSLVLAFAMLVSACKSDDDDSGGGGGGGGGSGIGSITISGIKAGLDGATIVHSTVSGTNQALNVYTLNGGKMNSGVFDDTGRSTITGGSVIIPVRGTKSGASFEFTDGAYRVQLSIADAITGADNGQYTLSVNFSGSNGKGTANASNGLGLN